MTTRTNHESDKQDYNNPEVQNLPRQNYGQAVLKKEREGKPTKVKNRHKRDHVRL